MDCIVLGRNGPYPSAGGACSGYLLKAKGRALLFDLGAGTFSRLVSFMDPAKVSGIFISHWHGDHCSDLLVFEYYLQTTNTKNFVKMPLYGPKDGENLLQQKITTSPFFDFTPVQPGDMINLGKLSVAVGPAKHPVPSVSYKAGDWGYTGDTNWLPQLEDFFTGIRWLFACGCVLQRDWTAKGPHLSAKLAAELTKKIEAEKLFLTHLKPTVDQQSLLKEGQDVFKNTMLVEEGHYLF